MEASLTQWHQDQKKHNRPCLNSIHCQPNKKPTARSGACQPCVDWANTVQAVCSGKDIQWSNTNVALFQQDPVEVAKGFVFKVPRGQQVTTFGDLDVGGILKLMMGFKVYHKGDQVCHDKIAEVSCS